MNLETPSWCWDGRLLPFNQYRRWPICHRCYKHSVCRIGSNSHRWDVIGYMWYVYYRGRKFTSYLLFKVKGHVALWLPGNDEYYVYRYPWLMNNAVIDNTSDFHVCYFELQFQGQTRPNALQIFGFIGCPTFSTTPDSDMALPTLPDIKNSKRGWWSATKQEVEISLRVWTERDWDAILTATPHLRPCPTQIYHWRHFPTSADIRNSKCGWSSTAKPGVEITCIPKCRE